MLDYFRAGIDKFFNYAGDALKPVNFSICLGEEYNISKDTKIKKIENHLVRCLVLERTEQTDDRAGYKKREIELVCRVKDFSRKPTSSDFFEINKRAYAVKEIIDDNSIYFLIKGE